MYVRACMHACSVHPQKFNDLNEICYVGRDSATVCRMT